MNFCKKFPSNFMNFFFYIPYSLNFKAQFSLTLINIFFFYLLLEFRFLLYLFISIKYRIQNMSFHDFQFHRKCFGSKFTFYSCSFRLYFTKDFKFFFSIFKNKSNFLKFSDDYGEEGDKIFLR